jgi:hypothetical protein
MDIIHRKGRECLVMVVLVVLVWTNFMLCVMFVEADEKVFGVCCGSDAKW